MYIIHEFLSFFFVSVKDEPDDSDNLAALTDFKEEDLKEFDNAVNDFSNGKIFEEHKSE